MFRGGYSVSERTLLRLQGTPVEESYKEEDVGTVGTRSRADGVAGPPSSGGTEETLSGERARPEHLWFLFSFFFSRPF